MSNIAMKSLKKLSKNVDKLYTAFYNLIINYIIFFCRRPTIKNITFIKSSYNSLKIFNLIFYFNFLINQKLVILNQGGRYRIDNINEI